MKNIPSKIYLHVDIDHDQTDDFNELDTEMVYWGTTPSDDKDLVFYSTPLQQSPLPVRECYQWIKASERLPENNASKLLHVNYLYDGKKCSGTARRFNNDWILGYNHDDKITEVEWLEQVTLPATEEGKNNGPGASNSI